MIEKFTLDRVNKAPASFDPAKLQSFQGDAFAELSDEKRTELVRPFAIAAGFVAEGDSDEALSAVVAAAGDRLKMAGDIIDFDYCFVDDYAVDEKAYEKRLVKADGAKELLAKLNETLKAATEFDAANVETTVKSFCESEGIKIGQIIHALRVATTGAASGFGMFDTLAVLGKDKVTARIEKTIAGLS